jgi:hypothetical protein
VIRRLVLLLLVLPSLAHAETVGLFSPTAPFPGPVARLDYITSLAAHLQSRLGGTWRGKTFARAGDFAAAVRRGELDYAVVDAAYLAAAGISHTVLAAAQRSGATAAPWEVVSMLPGGLGELKGRTLAVPDIGARAEPFVHDVLFEGEIARDHFARLQLAADALSALAAVERGRADAALVPAGLALPEGARRVVSLRPVAWPLLVSLRGAGRSDVAQAAASHDGRVFSGFLPGAGGADAVRALASRFSGRRRRVPILVPEPRLAAAALLAGSRPTMPRSDARSLLIVTSTPPNPAKPPAIGR